MKRIFFILISALLLIGCDKDKPAAVTLPTFSEIAVTPQKEVYALGDKVQCSIKMLNPGDESLKQATWWFYTSWWGSNPDMVADFCTPDDTTGEIIFKSSEIELTEKGEVRIYFWGRLEYPNWNFQPIKIPVTLYVE